MNSELPTKFLKGNSSGRQIDQQHGDTSGVTIVVLSFERMRALRALLKSLLRQDLDGIGLELMICNNSGNVNLAKSWFSEIGRLLSKFQDVKIFNSSHDWHTKVRYSLATMAKYEAVLFLDDDVILLDPNFIRWMFTNFKKLQPIDILSCWADIWVDWQPENFRVISLSFYEHDLEELTLVDSCGMGISMMNRRILFNPAIAGMDSIFEQIGDYAFSLMSNMELGTQCYFLPSYKMLKFHRQASKHAICGGDGFYKSVLTIFQFLLENGYRPLLEREANRFQDPSSPEAKALRLISPHVFPSS